MATLVRWDPAREIRAMREMMDRLFEDFFAPTTVRATESWALVPRVDMYETEDEVIVKAVVPGVKPDDLDISVTGNVLTIRGEVREEEELKDANFIRQERVFGSFRRDLTLPVEVDVNKAQAEFENGVLTLRLPKAEAAKPKRLQIKVKK